MIKKPTKMERRGREGEVGGGEKKQAARYLYVVRCCYRRGSMLSESITGARGGG